MASHVTLLPHALPGSISQCHARSAVFSGAKEVRLWARRGGRGGAEWGVRRTAVVESTCPTRGGAVRASVSVEKVSAVEGNREEDVLPGSVSVVLLAGGVGKRMGASMPKQYLPIRGQPIALYSFFTFASLPEVAEIVVVCDPSYESTFQDVSESLSVNVRFARPGKERQDSVFNGLQLISSEAALVAIHDSARPLVTEDEIKTVFRDATKFGAAVLGVPSKATIKEANEDGFVEKTLDRKKLWEMHTPQVMRPTLLREGFDLVIRGGLEVTDDVSIVEHLGHPVFITPGLYTNIKVTTPDDLLLAERIINERGK